MHWAPKNPGLHRQRPGFTHTSSSRQASSPSQMAEKHPTQVGRTVAWHQPGDTLPLSLAPSALPRQEPFPQGGGGGSGWTLALGLRRGNRRPQEGRQEGSLDYVLLSSQVGICSGYSRIVHSWSFCLQPGQHWSSAEGLWGREGSAGGQTDWLRRWITVSG